MRLILQGERNFLGIKLEEEFDISSHLDFKHLQDYMMKERYNFFDNPIVLRSASLRGLKAKETYLFSVNAANADLEGACLVGADLRFANLKGANLKYANLRKVRLSDAYLQEATVAGANLIGADFHHAHLDGIRNLEKSKGIEHGIYCKTRVSAREQKIIERAMTKINPFVKVKHQTDYDWLDDYSHSTGNFVKVPMESEVQETISDKIEPALK